MHFMKYGRLALVFCSFTCITQPMFLKAQQAAPLAAAGEALRPTGVEMAGAASASRRLPPPQEVENAGDHYLLRGGGRVDLQRVNDEVAVTFKVTPQNKGKAVADFMKARVRKGGRQFSLRQPAGDGAATNDAGLQILTAPGARASLADLKDDPAIATAAPVYLNPATGKRLIAQPEVLVMLKEGTEISAMAAEFKKLGLVLVRQVGDPTIRTYKLALTPVPNTNLQDVLAASRLAAALPGVEAAEPNFMQEIELSDANTRTNPNDTYYNRLTHLDNDGQHGLPAHADIGAPTAWQRLMGSTPGDLVEAGVAWSSGMSAQAGDLIFHGANLYQATATGVGSTAPTHTSGTVSNLRWMRQRPLAWSASTALALDALVYHENNVYSVSTAGTTHASSPPLHVSGSQTNGTAVLRFIHRRVPVIAIVDTGIDVGAISSGRYTNGHPDLRIYDNRLETAANGVDDGDPGSFIDDVSGWDFSTTPGDNNPQPGTAAVSYHGTACAGLAAARQNNSIGATGVAPGASILPVKIVDDSSGLFVSNERIADAMAYAALYADVISCSFGGSSSSFTLNAAITAASTATAERRGRPVFCSTGNFASDWFAININKWPNGTSVSLVPGQQYCLMFQTNVSARAIDDIHVIDASGNDILGVNRLENSADLTGWDVDGSIPGYTPQKGWSLSSTSPFPGSGGTSSLKADNITTPSTVAMALSPAFTGNGYVTLSYQARLPSSGYLGVFLMAGTPSSPVEVAGANVGHSSGYSVTTTTEYPASSASAIAVGASTDHDFRAPFSQYGGKLDFLAPGGGGDRPLATTDIRGTAGYGTGDYNLDFSGTSAACPIAAGVATLVLTAYPELTRNDVLRVLRESCDKVGGVTYGSDGRHLEYGHGRLDAATALQMAGSAPVITSASPSSIQYAATQRSVLLNGRGFYGNVTPPTFGGRTLRAFLTPAAGGTPVELTLSDAFSGSGLFASLPAGLAVGDYHIILTSPVGDSAPVVVNITRPEIAVEVSGGAALETGEAAQLPDALVSGPGTSKTFTISNTGDTDLAISSVSLGSGSSYFSLSPSLAGTVLASGASANFTVSFTPEAHLASGVHNRVVEIRSDDLDEPIFTINASAKVLAPEIYFTQGPVDGGSWWLGQASTTTPRTVTYTVRNQGLAELNGLVLTKDGPHPGDFTITSPPASSISPGGSTSFTIQFVPLERGMRAVSLHLASNDYDENPYDLEVSGEGISGTAKLVAEQPAGSSAQAHATGGVGFVAQQTNTPVSKVVTLRNIGTATVSSIALAVTGPQSAHFTVTGLGSTSLPAGATTSFTLSYSTPAAGFSEAALRITSNDLPSDFKLAGVLGGTLLTYTGSPGEASAAVALDDTKFIVGDSADETLRTYSMAGGAPIETVVLTSNADWTAGGTPATPNLLAFANDADSTANSTTAGKKIWREARIEAAARIGSRTFWMSSHGNVGGSSPALAPNRQRVFSLDLDGPGTSLQLGSLLKFGGEEANGFKYNLRNFLNDWDNHFPEWEYSGPHASDGFGFSNSDDLSADDEGNAGFNIEGMAASDRGTLFLGFRSPLVDPLRSLRPGHPQHRTHAIVVEVVPYPRGIGLGLYGDRPFELNLGGRGIRDMNFNGNTYLILAGRNEPLGQPDDFALFAWKPGFDPVLRFANFPSGLAPEAIVTFPAGDHYTPHSTDCFIVRVLSDAGVEGTRQTSGVFYSYDAAVPAPEDQFEFDRIPDLALHNNSLGHTRRVRLNGLTVPPGQTAVLSASVISGTALVPSVTAIQPGTTDEPAGAVEFTPASSQTTPAKALIRITVTVGTTPFTREFWVRNYSDFHEYTSSEFGNNTAFMAISGTGIASGSGDAMLWDRQKAHNWPSSMGMWATRINDHGVALGPEVTYRGDGDTDRALIWPAPDSYLGTDSYRYWASPSQLVPYPADGQYMALAGAYLDINNTGAVLIANSHWPMTYSRIEQDGSTAQMVSSRSLGVPAGWFESSGYPNSGLIDCSAQSMAEDGTIAGALHNSSGAIANFVWDQRNLDVPTMLQQELPGAGTARRMRISDSGIIVGTDDWQAALKVWKRTAGGWGTPAVMAMTAPNQFYLGDVNYHGQVLGTYTISGQTVIIDTGVTGATWPVVNLPPRTRPADTYPSEGLLLIQEEKPLGGFIQKIGIPDTE
ncbi:MAG: hypothetical protein B7Z37_00515 [Verrucomicrobia bacterium 12-59-8]|nr:MAG: hypothetical protein B7Z37_00515 [Verrucomicrobia bacterium 12-59-8]